MSRIHKTRGIVIRTVPYGDSDLILDALTSDRGKLSFIAKGARKSARRFGASLELLTLSEFVYYDRKGLKALNQATLERSFRALKQDYDRLTAAMRCARALNRLLADDHEEGDVFELFAELLEVLGEAAPVARLSLYELAFQLKLMLRLGWAPTFDACVGCREAPRQAAFSFAQGGLLCARCQQGDRSEEMPLAIGTARGLHMALKLPLAKLDRLKLATGEIQTGTQLVDGFIAYHLRPLTTDAS